MANTLNPVFKEILETRSLTVIHFLVDGALVNSVTDPVSEEDLYSLSEISVENDLDTIWLTCAKRLGDTEKVKEIEAFLAKKSARNRA